jgi:EmrB/QacA subfamily drug resistance transporter
MEATSAPTTARPARTAPPASDATVAPHRFRRLGLIGLAASVFVAVLDQTVLTVATPTIVTDLGASLRSIEWVIAGYAMVLAALLILAGRVGDIVGHKKIIIGGLAVFAGGSLLSALAPTVGWLAVGNSVLEGIGAAMMSAASLSLINAEFTGHERAGAFAFYGVAGGAAGAFGPVLGGWLTTNASWRWAFGLNVILAPIFALLVLVGTRETSQRSRTRLDLSGVALITATILLLVFGLLEAPHYGWWTALAEPSIGTLSIIPFCFAAAAVCFAAFLVSDRRKERAGHDPLYPSRRLAFPSYRYGNVTTGVLSIGEFTMFFVLAVVLQQNGHSAVQAGLWILPFGLMIIVGAGIGAQLTHTLGPKRTVVAGMTAEALGLAWIAHVIGPTMTFWSLVPSVVVYGIGAGFATAQLTALTMSEVPWDVAGVASGVNNTVREVGAALGIALVGTAFTVGASTAMWVTVAAVALGVVTSALIPKRAGELAAAH